MKCKHFTENIKNTIIYFVLTVILEEHAKYNILTCILKESNDYNIDYINHSYVKESVIQKK